MKYNKRLLIELVILFIIFPLVLCFPINLYIKIVLSLLGFSFVLLTLKREKYPLLKNDIKGYPSSFKKQITFVLILLIPATIFFVSNYDAKLLFYVLKSKPLVWVAIFFVYSLLSVLPQELIYRSFFFNRYKSLFYNSTLLIVTNAFVFALGHLFFQNTLVLLITFIGGLIFGYTYLKTKSLRLVFIEHTIYGYWLFTVGMGDMLGFPGG